MFKSLFFKNNKKNHSSIGGDIKYFGLTDWWLNDLTQEERQIIRDTYKPFGMSVGGEINDYVIDQGEIGETSQTKIGFLILFRDFSYFPSQIDNINLIYYNTQTNLLSITLKMSIFCKKKEGARPLSFLLF